MLREGFVRLCDYVPGLRQELRYATAHNLTGHPLAGYLSPDAVGTVELGDALRRALAAARARGFGLLVYDAYRPQKAVTDFVTWSLQPEDGLTKAEFYPRVDKERLFREGYIARRSGHSRGSTVDLTLTDSNGRPIDMGTGFDFMDDLSHHGAFLDSSTPGRNRRMLLDIMLENGFLPYQNEWWHYRLKDEPYPDTCFDFDID